MGILMRGFRSEKVMKIKLGAIFGMVFLLSFAMGSCENPLIQEIVGAKTAAFESNGGSRVASQTVFRDQPVRRPANPSKSGFAFAAWYSDNETFLEEWDFSVIPNKDITLYAKWNVVTGGGTFTVTFDKNGGDTDANPVSRTVNSGSLVTAPDTDPTREYFEFDGWYKEADCLNIWDFDTDTVTADITLYAKWEALPGVEVFTVTFDKNGGGTEASPQSREVVSGRTVAPPAEPPARTGYTVIGWYTEAEGGRQWDFAEDTVSADTTLYARWELIPVSNTHSVTFNSGGGTTVPVQIVASGQKASQPQGVTRNGYTLAGWFRDDGTFQNQWNFATDTVSADITLYAKWVEVPVVPTGPPTNWTAVANSPDIWLNAIAYGNNRFVAVGYEGKMATSPDGVNWTAVSNSTFGTRDIINAIAYGNNRFVAVGYEDSGSPNYTHTAKMAYSADGITWTAVEDSTFSTGALDSIDAIAYGGGKFVAGGWPSKMAYSADGVTWTAVADYPFASYDSIQAIAYDNGRWVVGSNSKMAYSSDGITWTAISNTIFTSLTQNYLIDAIAYGNNTWVAGGRNPNLVYPGKMATSPDGINWTAVPDSSFTSFINPLAIAYGNGWFVAGGPEGKMAYSADGVTWTAVADSKFPSTTSDGLGFYICAIAYGNNRFVAVGDEGKMAYSGDYVAPATRTVTFNSNGGSTVSPLTSVTHGSTITAPADPSKTGNTFGGWYRESTLTTPWNFQTDTVSADIILYAKWEEVPAPTNWTAVSNTTFGTSSIGVIAYGNNTWVAGGNGGKMAYSINNGVTWTAVTNSTFNSISAIYGIAYGNNRFVAGNSDGKMAYSADGITWTAIANSTFEGEIAVAYGNNRFIAGGDSGKMAYSADGITWTAVADSTFGTSYIWDIVYGNNRWVAIGASGKMAYSTDNGVTWTAVANTTFGTSYIEAIAYGNNRFVAVGSGGRIAYSADGASWTAVTNSTFGTGVYDSIYGIAYGNGTFVAVGADYDNDNDFYIGRIAYSTDGVTWTAVMNTTFGTTEIISVAYGNGRFIAGDDDGKMAYSDGQ
jgi:uncharacterized repeat protein (TIGR02543 family)